MGGTVSAMPQLPQNFPYFCLTFRQFDKIKLVQADQATIAQVLTAIQQVWPGAIAQHQWDNGAYEIKFNGYPFSASNSKSEAIASKKVACHLLATLLVSGWDPVVSTDLGRTTDLTSWFFQRNTTVQYLTAPHIFCLSMSRYDKLQLINAPGNFHQILTDAAHAAYVYGVQDSEVIGQDLELKLSGYPWQCAILEEGVHARKLLLEIIRRFDAQQYKLMTTANLKGTADCMFFKHDTNSVPGETRYIMLSLNANDRIRLIDSPPEVVEVVRACIAQFWPAGIQEQRDYTGNLDCFEFKLSGYPWCTIGYEAVSARLLITLIMQNLLAKGWAVLSGLDISRRINDKAVFVLRSCQPTQLPHFCLSPSDTDKIRLINASQDLINVAIQVIRANWPLGVEREGLNAGAYEWKLNGQPWSAYYGNDYIVARHLMAVLLHEFSLRGWRVICSADVSAKYISQQNGPDYPIDVHSWFLAQTGVGGAAVQGQPQQSQPMGFEGFGAPTAPTMPAAGAFDLPPPSYEEVTKNDNTG